MSETIDWDTSRAACPTVEAIKQLGAEGKIAMAHISQSGDLSTGVFSGRILVTLSEPIEDRDLYKPCSEIVHQDIETATGLTITDRCGTDKARWWAGTNNPENLIVCNHNLIVYDTQELIERAQVLVAANPNRYRAMSDTPARKTKLSKTTMRAIRFIFQELPPPDGESHQAIVTPAKALARMVEPDLDDDFCEWISSSEYRLRKIGGDPLRFLYAGDLFNNAGVPWFVRAADKIIPNWRESFKDKYGYHPGLDDFNPNHELGRDISSDF